MPTFHMLQENPALQRLETETGRIAGADYVMALTRGGVLLSWGTGQQGQLGRVGSRMRKLKDTLLRPHPVPFTRRIRGIGATKVRLRLPKGATLLA